MRWNGRNGINIALSSEYWNNTCGLCGTFDGDRMNDYRLPNGEVLGVSYSIKC